MAFSIHEFFQEARHKKNIDIVVDQTIMRMSATGRMYQDGMPDPALDMFCPAESFDSLVLLLERFRDLKPILGHIVGIGQEIPTRRGSLVLNENILGRLKFARGVTFTEEDYETLFKIEREMASDSPRFKKYLYDWLLKRPALLVASVVAIMKLLAIRTLVLGQTDYSDTDTGLDSSVSYLDQIPTTNFPAALTAGNQWTAANSTTADGIADIVTLLNRQYDILRAYPPYIIMNQQEAVQLRNQTAVREQVSFYEGRLVSLASGTSAANLKRPTMDEIGNTLSNELTKTEGSTGNVKIIVTSGVYYRQTAEGDIVNEFGEEYFPPGYVAVGWPGAVIGAMMPISSNNFGRAISVQSSQHWRREPRQEVLTAATAGLPVVADPRKIGSLQVA